MMMELNILSAFSFWLACLLVSV